MSGHWSDWIFDPIEDFAGFLGEIAGGVWKAGERAVSDFCRGVFEMASWPGRGVRRAVRSVRTAARRKRSGAGRGGGTGRRSGAGRPTTRARSRQGRRSARRASASEAGWTLCLQSPKAPTKPKPKPKARTTEPRRASVKPTTRRPPVSTPSTKPGTTTPSEAPVMSNIENLGEAPQTDADHLEKINAIAEEYNDAAEKVEEYVAQCKAQGFDDAALSALERAAELAAEMAREYVNAAQDFESTYEGIRETAAAGVKIPGKDGEQNTWWTGEGGGR